MTVSTADGRGVTYRKRDPRAFRSMLSRSVALHRELRALGEDGEGPCFHVVVVAGAAMEEEDDVGGGGGG